MDSDFNNYRSGKIYIRIKNQVQVKIKNYIQL